MGAEIDALNKEQSSPLMTACAEGKTDVVNYLIHVGANVDLRSFEGMTCLHLAAKNGHIEAVHAVLTNGKLSTRKNLLNKTVAKFDAIRIIK